MFTDDHDGKNLEDGKMFIGCDFVEHGWLSSSNVHGVKSFG